MIEIELKFPLLNPEQVIDKLNLIAQSEKSKQKDIYFTPPHRNFLESKPISEWLRLRESEKGFTVNYKKWHNAEGKAVSCDEFETTIGNVALLKKIFESINLKEIITVDKSRNTWNYKDTIIAVDEVTDLGFFLEIEAKGTFTTIDQAKQHLYTVLEELNAELGPQDFKGYPYRMLEQKGLL